jgi:hypothetical protein
MRKLFSVFIALILLSCESTDNTLPKSVGSTNEKKVQADSNVSENRNRIEKKYGVQWDFCDCVKKNDSLDKLLKKTTLSDAETDLLLIRADEVEKKCKLFLTDLQSKKPSDRAAHQAKVKACLEVE